MRWLTYNYVLILNLDVLCVCVCVCVCACVRVCVRARVLNHMPSINWTRTGVMIDIHTCIVHTTNRIMYRKQHIRSFEAIHILIQVHTHTQLSAEK